MSCKHTAGTYSAEPHGSGYGLYAGRDRRHHGLRLLNIEDWDINLAANMRLICAAPEPLAAC
jgi:hypothetical protein